MAGSSHAKSSEHGGRFILGVDVDDTLLPTKERPEEVRERAWADLRKLTRALNAAPHLLGRGTVTGRTFADHDSALVNPAFKDFVDSADFAITSVGTVIHHRVGDSFKQDTHWPRNIEGWQPSVINDIMIKRPELIPQPSHTQNAHKLSYYVLGVPDAAHNAYVGEIEQLLADASKKQERLGRGQVLAQTIFSSGENLDFLPLGVHKGSAYDHVIDRYATNEHGVRAFSVAGGNGMNDQKFLHAADLGIIVGNADISLRRWGEANPDGIYIADQPYAAGVLEGLQYAATAGLIDFPTW